MQIATRAGRRNRITSSGGFRSPSSSPRSMFHTNESISESSTTNNNSENDMMDVELDPLVGYDTNNSRTNTNDNADNNNPANNSITANTNNSTTAPSNNGGSDNNSNNNSTTDLDAAAAAVWRERERRQRTIRFLMMFLLMLLLMEGEDGNGNKNNNTDTHNHSRVHLRRRRSKYGNRTVYDDNGDYNAGDNGGAYDILDDDEDPRLEPAVFASRRAQDLNLRRLAAGHSRYKELVEKHNGGMNVELEVYQWAEQEAEQEADEFGREHVDVAAAEQKNSKDPAEDRKVFHYPWNTTGFYRGEWVRNASSTPHSAATMAPTDTASSATTSLSNATLQTEKQVVERELDPTDLEDTMVQLVKARGETVGVFSLPPGYRMKLRDDNNLTSMHWDDMRIDSVGKVVESEADRSGVQDSVANNPLLQSSETADASNNLGPRVTLTHDSGRAAFQLFSRSIPAVSELSLVDGFVKLYDSTSPGYSTRKDILLRVRGVLIHALGRLSLVSNVDIAHSALVIPTGSTGIRQAAPSSTSTTTTTGFVPDSYQRHRRLQEILASIYESPDVANDETKMETLRDDALALYGGTVSDDEYEFRVTSAEFLEEDDDEDDVVRMSPEVEDDNVLPSKEAFSGLANDTTNVQADTQYSLTDDTEEMGDEANDDEADSGLEQLLMHTVSSRRTLSQNLSQNQDGTEAGVIGRNGQMSNAAQAMPAWSDVVMSFPFVRDDDTESIREARTPAARIMPPREQTLEANAAACRFEINMDLEPVEWTVGAWRKLLSRYFEEAKRLDPTRARTNDDSSLDNKSNSASSTLRAFSSSSRKTQAKLINLQEQALAMNMVGSIVSPNCDFSASLNATALRTDWDAATTKAINYSFYMMLVCLTQILVLLRQLLHSQAQSAATRVSLLGVGWQTVIDALGCLVHIYLSLAIQPLFTAFASISFFQLLLFCVIEMKYMAIILQARTNSQGGISSEALRRKVAVLHLRFYVALLVTFTLMYNMNNDKYRLVFMLVLHSFWVPQIIMNIVTEAKTALHPHYVFGMSLTRVVAPCYVYAVRYNFLKEVYADSPYDLFMCQMLVLWVAFQTAILYCQSKYGARFMIPARFLPPKFDYSRPIPPSLLPPGALEALKAAENAEDAAAIRPSPPTSLDTSIRETSASPPRARHTTAVTTRNRMRGNRRMETTMSMTTEEPTAQTLEKVEVPTLDCSICYDAIDLRKRREYMLAPCNHLYHRHCLEQWMDVKMECPICRTELPSL